MGLWVVDFASGGLLTATTFGSALLYGISGFGFAVLAAPLFLLFLDPARAIQLVIIISTVLSIVVLRGLWPAIAPWLLLRLALGSLVGLPLGLVAFRYADPILVRAAAGAMIFGFAIMMAVSRRRSGHTGTKHWTAFAMSPRLDLAAGAVSGIASALVGQPGPPRSQQMNLFRPSKMEPSGPVLPPRRRSSHLSPYTPSKHLLRSGHLSLPSRNPGDPESRIRGAVQAPSNSDPPG
jgi:uncharacterized membrane protein YfcA